MWSEGISRPIPCNKRNVQVKVARKIQAAHRQKENLDSLYKVMAPGSTIGNVSPATNITKEPNRPEVRVRNSDIVNFGTRHECDTELGQHTYTRPKKTQEKTLEQKFINHKRSS